MQAGRMHPIYTSTRIDWLSIGGARLNRPIFATRRLYVQ